MATFLNETDQAFKRMGAELTLLEKLIEAQKQELETKDNQIMEFLQDRKEKIATIQELVEAKEAHEKHAKELELQIERMKEPDKGEEVKET